MPPQPSAAPDGARSSRHRYGVVLGLTILAVLFSILAPETPVGRAVALLLEGTMLFAIIATSREAPAKRGLTAALTVAALAVLAVLVGLSVVPHWVGAAAGAAVVAAVLVALTRGLIRLIRTGGVTVQAVAGALTTYLLIGLEFALVIRVAAGLSSHPYFAQTHSELPQSQLVYFSFTTLTTTGYGDLTPILNFGRMVAVLEMLIGQIYLVTVIGLLVGNLRRRPSQSPGA